MALFSRKPKKPEENPQKFSEVSKGAMRRASSVFARVPSRSVLLTPRVTEKATGTADQHVYVFNIEPRATKPEVRRSVEALFKVHVEKIHVVRIPTKTVTFGARRTTGRTGGGKKAYVYLRKGERIEVV